MRVLITGCMLLASGLLFADQTPNANPPVAHHHARAKYHARRTAASRRSPKSAGRCEHMVTVINGQSPMTTCSDVPANLVASSGVPGRQNAQERASSSGRVEIINGTAWSTRTFSEVEKQLDLTPAERARTHPVVTGIASSATEAEKAQPVVVAVASSELANTGSAQPVVVGIASSGLDSNRSAAPVAVGVAPIAPKRPPYRRPDPQ